ncbi:hypothetical protein BDZ89DRAFT_1154896 [Hymenopellis radicata]|nr:hypothetical protein BDZ89DRAFT_1154896 [Hymenopellis radicata]
MTDLNNSVAVPLEDICIEVASPKITTPIPCARFSSTRLDPLEFAMGYSRGEMDAVSKTDESFNIRVREDVFESLCKVHSWGIIHTVDEFRRLDAFFRSNYDAGVKHRVMYTEEFPIQPSYTYCLFFNVEYVQLRLPDGRPCLSGQTLVTTTLHPCLALALASDFVAHNNPPDVDKATDNILLSLGMHLTRPIWLSWFQNRPRLTTPRPQAHAYRDRPTHS